MFYNQTSKQTEGNLIWITLFKHLFMSENTFIEERKGCCYICWLKSCNSSNEKNIGSSEKVQRKYLLFGFSNIELVMKYVKQFQPDFWVWSINFCRHWLQKFTIKFKCNPLQQLLSWERCTSGVNFINIKCALFCTNVRLYKTHVWHQEPILQNFFSLTLYFSVIDN